MVHLNLTRDDPEFKEAKKTSLFERQIQGRQQMIDKDRGPQIHDHNLYISVMSLVHGPQKNGRYSIHFSLHPEVAWDRLVSLTHSQLQATCCKYFARWSSQVEA